MIKTSSESFGKTPSEIAGIWSTLRSRGKFDGASVSGWYMGHPKAQYFGLGLIDRDQIQDYAARRSISIDEAEQWLAPNLGYTPKSRNK